MTISNALTKKTKVCQKFLNPIPTQNTLLEFEKKPDILEYRNNNTSTSKLLAWHYLIQVN